MSPELEHELVTKYPNIFHDYAGDRENNLMAFGMECGDGWYDIIDNLCHVIQSEVDFVNEHYSVSFRCEAVQVKEKYGTLRFYIHFFYGEKLSDEQMDRVNMSMNIIHGAITMAERMSSRSCGTCGAKSTLSDDIFPKNECDGCFALHSDILSNRDPA